VPHACMQLRAFARRLVSLILLVIPAQPGHSLTVCIQEAAHTRPLMRCVAAGAGMRSSSARCNIDITLAVRYAKHAVVRTQVSRGVDGADQKLNEPKLRT
jgi:hypothetical protein